MMETRRPSQNGIEAMFDGLRPPGRRPSGALPVSADEEAEAEVAAWGGEEGRAGDAGAACEEGAGGIFCWTIVSLKNPELNVTHDAAPARISATTTTSIPFSARRKLATLAA